MPALKHYLNGIVGLVLLFFIPATQADTAQESLGQFFDKHAVVMLLIDPTTGRIEDANQAASQYYGYSKSKLTQMGIQQINALSPEAVAAERKLAQKENRNYFIFRHRLADGSVRTVEVSSVPVVLNNRTLLFSIITDVNDLRAAKDSLWHYQNRLEEMVDQQLGKLKKKESFIFSLMTLASLSLLTAAITLGYLLFRRKQSSARLQIERDRLNDIIWGTHAGTWEWNIVRGHIAINTRWAEALGYSREELNPLNIDRWESFFHPEDLHKSQQLLRKNFSGELEYYETEARMRHKNGHWIWVLIRGKIVTRDSEGRATRMSGTQQDITAQKETSLQLEYLAHYDSVTEIPNRSLFFDRFDHALTSAQRYPTRLAVMFIDLDGFKGVNDQYGHHAGDELLKLVASRLKLAVRKSDTCARMGGDEFAVLLYHLEDTTAASTIAEHILKALSEPYELKGGHRVKITCSIGIALYPEHGGGSNNLIQQADNAMYIAKESGKNRFAFAGASATKTNFSGALELDEK